MSNIGGMQVSDAGPPSLWRFFGEARALRHRARFDAVPHVARGHDGGGRPVIIIPGFMGSDVLSLRLRRTLAIAGYEARGWGMGVNTGLRQDTIDRLLALLVETQAATGRPVVLVGWSLGGIFAREVAKLRPELVERVVTLASPFSGDPRANNVWRFYERMAGHPVDRPPIDVDMTAKPPVPTIALWSRRDGLVAPACSRGLEGERDIAIEVDCGHVDFASAPRALRAILDALSLDTSSLTTQP